MIEVIGVSFEDSNKVYYFSPNKLDLKKDVFVIVETERGLQFGKTTTDVIDLESSKVINILKPVVRIATKEDEKKQKENINLAKEAIKNADELVRKNKLNMSIISANFTFDRRQLLFQFVSEERVDFRKLAKELAAMYKTRIELRQIGVRDKAKEIGGIGSCGRCLCCSTFLKTFDSLSINMAKNQNLALNPSKINGSCGRLLCCLDYENDLYEKCKKGMPNVGEKIKTKNETKKVISVDILNRRYKTINEDNQIEEIVLK